MKKKEKKPLWQWVIDPQVIEVIKLIHFYNHWTIPVTVGQNILTAIKPFINVICSAMILDRLISGAGAFAVMQVVYWMVALNLVCSLLISVLDWLMQSYLSLNSVSEQRFSEKALQLDYERMEQTDVRDMIRLHDQVKNIGGISNFLNSFGRIVKYLVSLVYAFILILPFFFTETITEKGIVQWIFTSPLSGIILAATLSISIWCSIINFRKKQKAIEEDWESSLKFNRITAYFHFSIAKYQNGKDIRSYRLVDIYLKRFRECMEQLMIYLKKQTKLEEEYGGRIIFISQTAVTLFYIIVGTKALFGVITVGSILKYVNSLTSFYESFIGLLNDLTEMNIAALHLKCDTDFFSIKNKKYEGQIPVEKRDDNEYELEFKDVSFSYPGSEHKVLDHVSFHFKVGSKIALVGKNGAGKTTFIKLLCRLYDPTDGQILLNGIDIKKYDYREYQSLFSVVFQDFKLFSFELGENIASNVTYDEEQVWNCLKKAGLEDRVKKMKNGLQTVLYQTGNEGMEISGGEAQKIAIARALYKDAPVIILDEPTSALDPISEYEIYSKFDELVSNKTAIYISHRMSSCRFCNNIVVFDHGGICESGNHEELLAKKGLYYNMWQAQSQYYEEDQADAEKVKNYL